MADTNPENKIDQELNISETCKVASSISCVDDEDLVAANSAINNGDLKAAIQLFSKIVERDSSNLDNLSRYCELLTLNGELSRAALLLKAAIREESDSFILNLTLANILLTGNRFSSEALFYSAQALALSPNNIQAIIIRSLALRRDGRLREALALLEVSRSKEPSDPRIYKELSDLYCSIGDLIRERAILDEASRISIAHDGMIARIKEIDTLVGASRTAEPFPRVTVVIPTCSGRLHLDSLLLSLDRQKYPYFDIVIVDDNSIEDLSTDLQNQRGDILVYRTKERVGYAESCNIGLDLSATELVTYINDDTKVDELWLFSLVSRISQDRRCAVVTSKVLFWHKFVPVHIESSSPIVVKREPLVQALKSYPKIFVDRGDVSRDGARDWIIKDRSRFLIPRVNAKAKFIFQALEPKSSEPIVVKVKFGEQLFEFNLTQEHYELELDTSCADSHAVDVINNAGSDLSKDGVAKDIGLGWPDRKQHDKQVDLSAFCGCSFIIRRSALGNEPLFSPILKAYWEDTELSVRLRERGYRIAYEPKSIVRHKHASTSEEYSDFFWRFVIRNEYIFLKTHFSVMLAQRRLSSALRRLIREFNKVKLAKEIRDEIRSMESSNLIDNLYFREKKVLKFGIYNNYWSTYGGGERRALEIAEVLEKYGIVDLIGREDNFSLSELENRFGFKFKRVRKVISYDVSLSSKAYDLFINSTHGSTLESKADKSVYLASFPDTNLVKGNETGLDSYSAIWANSYFTAKYIKGRWKRPAQVVYPGGLVGPSATNTSVKKEKLFLVVARYFSTGHCKKQIEIVRAFKSFKERYPQLSKDWKLVLVGSIQDQSYYDEVVATAEHADIEVNSAVSLEYLKKLFNQAAYLVHGTGIGEDVRLNPERMEHFGISVLEGMSHGCIPITFKHGGFREITGDSLGYVFENKEQMIDKLKSAAHKFTAEYKSYISDMEKSLKRSQKFSQSEIHQAIFKAIEQELPQIKDIDQDRIPFLNSTINH